MNYIEEANKCGFRISQGSNWHNVSGTDSELTTYSEAILAQSAKEIADLRQQLAAEQALVKVKDEYLIDARASFLGLQPDFGGPVSAQMGKAIERINNALSQTSPPAALDKMIADAAINAYIKLAKTAVLQLEGIASEQAMLTIYKTRDWLIEQRKEQVK
jgi:hypothetical protein